MDKLGDNITPVINGCWALTRLLKDRRHLFEQVEWDTVTAVKTE